MSVFDDILLQAETDLLRLHLRTRDRIYEIERRRSEWNDQQDRLARAMQNAWSKMP